MANQGFYAPPQHYGPPPEAPPTPATNKLIAPAIILIVANALGIVGGLLNVVQLVASGGDPISGPPLSTSSPHETGRMIGMLMVFVGALVGGTFNIFAAFSMYKARSRGFALAACVLSMIPCTTGCCWLGLVGGIWGLMVLNQPDVRAAFDRQS